MNNSIRGKILCLLFATFAFLSASISKADHVEPEVKTQVNKQTDLFEKSIQDLPDFNKKLEEVKQDGINSLGEKGGTPEGLKFITKKSKGDSKHSCLTPVVTWNSSDSLPSWMTWRTIRTHHRAA